MHSKPALNQQAMRRLISLRSRMAAQAPHQNHMQERNLMQLQPRHLGSKLKRASSKMHVSCNPHPPAQLKQTRVLLLAAQE